MYIYIKKAYEERVFSKKGIFGKERKEKEHSKMSKRGTQGKKLKTQ